MTTDHMAGFGEIDVTMRGSAMQKLHGNDRTGTHQKIGAGHRTKEPPTDVRRQRVTSAGCGFRNR